MADIEIRPPTEDEYPLWWSQMRDGFLMPPQSPSDTLMSEALDVNRLRLVFAEDGTVVGTVGAFRTDLMIHGKPVAAAAQGLGTIRTDFGGRGIFRTLCQELNEDAQANGEWLGMTFTSHGGLHRGMGFGIAAPHDILTLDVRELATIKGDASVVRLIDRPTAIATLPGLHERAMARRSAGLLRPPALWRAMLDHDPDDEWYGGWSSWKTAIVPDQGYVMYRARAAAERHQTGTLEIGELVAVTAEASAHLWRFLAGIDMVGTVVAPQRPQDDPLPHLLRDVYAIRRERASSLWVRIVDLGNAWRDRPFLADGELTVEVHDRTRPANTGRWRLAVRDGVGEADRVETAPDVELDASDLGAAWLGGTAVTSLVAAGRVVEHDAGAAWRLQQILAGPTAPWSSWWF